MQEYWHSSLLACERYLNSPNITIDQKLYQGVPNSFKEIRPWVKYGWEMILIVHEIIKTENPLKSENKDDFINNYHQNCQRILNENSWIAEDLQKILDKSRKYQIDKDFELDADADSKTYTDGDLVMKNFEIVVPDGDSLTGGKIFDDKSSTPNANYEDAKTIGGVVFAKAVSKGAQTVGADMSKFNWTMAKNSGKF